MSVLVNEEELNKQQRLEIYLCIMVRIGFIETGTMHRAKDLKTQKDFKPKILSTEQMNLIVELERLANSIV